MPVGGYYRGGPNLQARLSDVRINRATGKLKPSRGVSIYDRADHPNLASHGGAYLVSNLPDRLQIIQTGIDPSHHEIIPAENSALTFEEFQALLDQIVLTPVQAPHEGE